MSRAFSLVEVLVAMALAALVLGVLLRSVGLELAGVARVIPRFQNLVLASYELEAALGERTPGEESRDFYPYPREPGEGDPWKLVLESEVTTADPRLEQVTLTLTPATGVPVSVTAYRLRARHQDEPFPAGSPGASPSPRPNPSLSPGGPTNQTATSGATPGSGATPLGGGSGFGNTTGSSTGLGTTGGGL